MLDWVTRQINALEERVKRYVDDRLASSLEYTQYSRSSKLGSGDKTVGHKADGAGERDYDHDAQRMQHFGLRSLPPKGTWCIRLAAAGGNTNGVIVAEDPGNRYGPQDLEDGELALYNKVTGCVIKLDKNGKVTITASAGQIVAINGQSWSAPQWEQFIVALSGFLTSLAGATDPAVAAAATTFSNAMSSGNAGAAAANYKSPNVKWG